MHVHAAGTDTLKNVDERPLAFRERRVLIVRFGAHAVLFELLANDSRILKKSRDFHLQCSVQRRIDIVLIN
ncbi:MAG: hypothetical protein C5B57_07795 [Blastocatellia bacterium]|nr:MAG: hypothetical protein C5B57_07795 [Blastocatellia bacterium]